MKVDTKGHTTTIKDTQLDLASFVMKVTNEHKSFESQNLIIDLSAYEELSTSDLNSFLPLAKVHKKAKKSLVIVGNTDFNKASEKITIVPTALEAHDMIEMDEIERDLGF